MTRITAKVPRPDRSLPPLSDGADSRLGNLGGQRSESEPSHHAKDGAPLGMGGGSRKRPATLRAASVTRRSPERTVSATYSSNSSTVGGIRSRGRRTSSAASICSSWNRCLPRSSSRPTVSRSNRRALSTRQACTQSRRAGSVARTGVPHRIDTVDPLVHVVDAISCGMRFLLSYRR